MTEEREEEIEDIAECQAHEDVHSCYPLIEEDDSVLQKTAKRIARDYLFTEEEIEVFLAAYVSLYHAEVECLDQDYKPESDNERCLVTDRLERKCKPMFSPNDADDPAMEEKETHQHILTFTIRGNVTVSCNGDTEKVEQYIESCLYAILVLHRDHMIHDLSIGTIDIRADAQADCIDYEEDEDEKDTHESV